VLFAMPAILIIWLLAMAGYRVAGSFEITVDKVVAYDASVDVSRLTGADRTNAFQKLTVLLNSLALADRQQLWPQIIPRWLAAMNDGEKAQFLTATALPGFKQQLDPIDQLPPERRQQALDERLNRLRELRARETSGPVPATTSTNP